MKEANPRARGRTLAAALAVLLAAVAARAQDAGEPLCGDCHTTGKVAHDPGAQAVEQDANVVLCSFVLRRDPDALGLDWIVCPRCRTPSVQARARQQFDAEHARRRAWLDEREAEVDARAGHPVEHLQTKHFLLAWDVPKTKVGRAVLDEHEAIHLYARRMEELFAQILEIHGITERNTQRTLHKLYVFESQRTARQVGDQVLDGGFGTGNRKSTHGRNSQSVCYWDRQRYRDDEAFHQAMVHSVSHLLHNDIDQFNTWLFQRYGWVYEGLAHYLEIRNFGPPITWCHREQGNFEHWKGDAWEANVKKAVIAGQAPPFQEVITRSADVLSPMEHQFAWSYVDYLMWLDPKRMPALIGHMKGPRMLPTRDALKHAYGLTVGQFVEGWEEFVRTEYSTRPVKGPSIRRPKGGS